MKLIKLLLVLFITFTFAQTEKTTTILISFDGFRWDFTDRDITPNLQYLIDKGVKASSLQPCFPSKTFPNHYSIITGMYPENHGIIFNSIPDDFSNLKYSLRNRNEVQNGKWYQGEAFWETAERQGITCASYFWPGSELTIKYRRPTYFQEYDHKRDYTKRINDVLKWIDLPDEEKPEFITLYFDATDTYGHKFGPDSDENNEAIKNLDKILGRLIQGLTTRNQLQTTNIIVVSDHGMTNIYDNKIINVDEILKGYKFVKSNSGPVMMIKPENGNIDKIYKLLKTAGKNFKTYKKENVPDHFHFNKHPFIYPIVLIADLGYSIMDSKSIERWKGRYSKGNHGYDNHEIDMHGIFIASGPDFKNNYKCGTIKNINIYPLLCEIFKIYPRQNIDGKLEEIKFILKD